jgi:hypothetical protein
VKPKPTQIDFGKVYVHTDSSSATAIWTNTGTKDAKVSGALVNQPFHIVSAPKNTFTVKPKKATPKFSFKFRPVTDGQIDHKVPLLTTSPCKTLELVGEGVWQMTNKDFCFANLNPKYSSFYGGSAPISKDRPIDFGVRPLGNYEVTAEFTVENTTSKDIVLVLSLIENCPLFRIITPKGGVARVPSKKFTVIQIGFTPKKLGKWNDVLEAKRAMGGKKFAGIVITGEVVAEKDWNPLDENKSGHAKNKKKSKSKKTKKKR